MARYKGAIDNQWGPIVRGWAISGNTKGATHVSVVGDGVVKIVEAKTMRTDLKELGLHPTGLCGFSVDFGHRLSEPAKVTIIKKEFELSMSRPAFQNKPIFFMHIAKTAGSSLNKFFIQHYGKKSASMHVEAVSDWATLANHRFISGHVGYEDASQKINLDNYLKVTFLRNPIDQLISHFNWVRHLSEPENKNFLMKHPEIIKEISEKLSGIDFSDAAQMRDFVNNLRPVELSLFDNAQSRYFYQLKKPNSKYKKNDCENAVKNMENFDFIGLTDDFDSGVIEICEMAGFVKEFENAGKVNVNKFDYGFDKKNLELLAIIKPLIEYDFILYNKVKN